MYFCLSLNILWVSNPVSTDQSRPLRSFTLPPIMVMSGCNFLCCFWEGNPDALNNQYSWVSYSIWPGLKGVGLVREWIFNIYIYIYWNGLIIFARVVAPTQSATALLHHISTIWWYSTFDPNSLVEKQLTHITQSSGRRPKPFWRMCLLCLHLWRDLKKFDTPSFPKDTFHPGHAFQLSSHCT